MVISRARSAGVFFPFLPPRRADRIGHVSVPAPTSLFFSLFLSYDRRRSREGCFSFFSFLPIQSTWNARCRDDKSRLFFFLFFLRDVEFRDYASPFFFPPLRPSFRKSENQVVRPPFPPLFFFSGIALAFGEIGDFNSLFFSLFLGIKDGR